MPAVSPGGRSPRSQAVTAPSHASMNRPVSLGASGVGAPAFFHVGCNLVSFRGCAARYRWGEGLPWCLDKGWCSSEGNAVGRRVVMSAYIQSAKARPIAEPKSVGGKVKSSHRNAQQGRRMVTVRDQCPLRSGSVNPLC